MTQSLKLSSALSRGVRVRQVAETTWSVNEPQQKNLRLTRQVRIQNAGKPTPITLRMTAANPSWMSHVYLVQGRHVQIIRGQAEAGRVSFTITAPRGESLVGPEIWYSNEDGDRFFERMLRHPGRCQVDVIGHTLQGRPIRRLIMGNLEAKKVVVVAGREHADEPSGSFAVEAVAEHLLEQGREHPLCRSCRFDLIPIVNPDGVAHGEAYPQPGASTSGQPNPSDPHYCGMTSNDPTVRAWRDYLFAQKPAAIVNYHAYWALSFPQVIFYDKADGMAMVNHLIHDDLSDDCRWYVMRQAAEARTMLQPCVEQFGSVVAMFELPWRGRSVAQVKALGVNMFLAATQALQQRKTTRQTRLQPHRGHS